MFRAFVSLTDPTQCTLVLVGEEYSTQMAAVSSRVDQIADQMGRVPVAVFFFLPSTFHMKTISIRLFHPDVVILLRHSAGIFCHKYSPQVSRRLKPPTMGISCLSLCLYDRQIHG